MTLTYQNYSGKSKKRRQKLTKGYKKANSFINKSSESLEIAQNYATDQDLVYINMAVSSPLKMNISKMKIIWIQIILYFLQI